MAFEDTNEEVYCDIFSEQFDEKLFSITGTRAFDKHMLKEFVMKRARREFMQLHSDWVSEKKIDNQSLLRLLERNSKIDCHRNLPQILKRLSRFCLCGKSIYKKQRVFHCASFI
jgi:hypothetical protein